MRQRNNMQVWTPAELAIYNAMQEVEKMDADVILTNAVIKLSEAKELVADFIDSKECDHEYKCTLDTDTWSSYECKKCGDTKIVDFD